MGYFTRAFWGSFIGRAAWTIALIVLGALGVGPDKWFGFLMEPGTPLLILRATFVIAALLILIFAPWLRPEQWRLPRSIIYRLKGSPIIWDFTNFMGCGQSQGESLRVSGFQATGRVRKRNAVFSECFLRSISGEILPVLFDTSDGYVTVDQLNPLPKGLEIRIQAQFPKMDDNAAREGTAEDIFMKRWGSFDLCLIYGKRQFEETFPLEAVRKALDAGRLSTVPEPMATRKS